MNQCLLSRDSNLSAYLRHFELQGCTGAPRDGAWPACIHSSLNSCCKSRTLCQKFQLHMSLHLKKSVTPVQSLDLENADRRPFHLTDDILALQNGTNVSNAVLS